MNILKLIPSDPFLTPDDDLCRKAVDYLLSRFPDCQIEEGVSKLPQFVDCGDGLEQVECPLCGAAIDSEDWSCMMDALYGEYGFASLKADMPCCGGCSSLDRLIYTMPCGFSCYEIDIYDPPVLPEDIASALSQHVGLPFSAVISHI